MAENLVIVESPAKAKTIKKYLGKDFEVLASYGHVRDLVPKEGAVDPDNGFAMQYRVLEKNERHVDAIAKALKKSKALYLATDPDREGEAIAWHLQEMLNERGELKGKDVHRVVFYEITHNAIRAAVAQPRGLSLELVNAQQARRALDYLVGFNLSPLLWKKVRRGLSAGRVQSPALRMICEREDEIAAFMAQEYWTLEGEGEHSGQGFPLKLIEYRGKKVEQFSFTNEAAGARGRKPRSRPPRGAAGGALTVLAIDRKQRRRNPAPPFTTSTLQQEAARKLGFNARRTMRLAQQLYEGVDIGEGSVGLITYMRTDSVSLAAEAVTEIREVAAKLYGAAGSRRRAAHLQDQVEERAGSARGDPPDLRGHHAARTSRARSMRTSIKLYSLIWKRAVASQMSHAVFDTVAVDMLAGADGAQRHLLRANGSTLVKPGYIAVYQEGSDDAKVDDADHVLPPMNEGDACEPHGPWRHAAFHRAAAALLGSLAGEGARRARHRPTVDLRHHHLDAAGPRVRRDGQPALHPDRHRQDRQPLPDARTSTNTWSTASRPRWKTSSTPSRAAKKTGPRRSRSSGSPSSTQVEHDREERLARGGRAGARARQGPGDRQADDGAHGPLRPVRADRHQGRRREAASSPACVPGRRWTPSRCAEAMELFKLPRTLGETAEGEPIVANIGRFGPYIKYGAKYVSLKEDDPYTVTLERALEVIRLKKEADANRLIQDFGVDDIQVLNGRYGPYITDKKKNAKIPKDRDPKSLTLEECRALLAAAPERGAGRFGRFRKRAAAPAAPRADGAAATAAAPAKPTRKKAAKPPAPAAEPAAPARASAAKPAAPAAHARPKRAARGTRRSAAPTPARKRTAKGGTKTSATPGRRA